MAKAFRGGDTSTVMSPLLTVGGQVFVEGVESLCQRWSTSLQKSWKISSV